MSRRRSATCSLGTRVSNLSVCESKVHVSQLKQCGRTSFPSGLCMQRTTRHDDEMLCCSVLACMTSGRERRPFCLKAVSGAFFLLLGIPVEQCSGVFIAENAHRCASPTRHPQEKVLVDPGAAAIDKKHQHHDEKHTRYDSNKRYVVHGKSPCSFSG